MTLLHQEKKQLTTSIERASSHQATKEEGLKERIRELERCNQELSKSLISRESSHLEELEGIKQEVSQIERNVRQFMYSLEI